MPTITLTTGDTPEEHDLWADFQQAEARRYLAESIADFARWNFGDAHTLAVQAWRLLQLSLNNRKEAARMRVVATIVETPAGEVEDLRN